MKKNILKNNIYMLRHAWYYDKLYFLVKVTADSILTAFSTILNVYSIKICIDKISERVTIDEMLRLILFIAAGYIVLDLASKGINIFYRLRSIRISHLIQQDLYKKAAEVDLECYDNPEYFDKFAIAVNEFEKCVFREIDLVSGLLSAIASLAILANLFISIQPLVAIFPILSVICFTYFAFKTNKKIHKKDMDIHKAVRQRDYARRVFYQPEYAKELRLTNIKFPLTEQFCNSVKELHDIVKKQGLRIAVYEAAYWVAAISILMYFAQYTVMAYMALVLKSVTIGEIVAVVNASNNMRGHLYRISDVIQALRSISLYTENCREFIEYKIKIKANEPIRSIAGLSSPKEIRFENVSFRYNNNSPYVIKNVSITIKSGEKIAIVGHNGAGKSTLVKLLLRLYDPTGGDIFYDGINIKNINPAEYRKLFGTVFQDFHIYAATVAENLLMGAEDSKDKEELLQSALEKTDMLDIVNAMRNGADTMLTREFSEEGELLSGGQSQKTAISRIFMNDFRIAVLDEPSSALDAVAEYELNKMLFHFVENKSVIFISHRLSSTVMAEKIFHFENGEIIESGSHDELIANNGKYKAMFDVQAHRYSK